MALGWDLVILCWCTVACNAHSFIPQDDDGFTLWESKAILRYICNKHKLEQWYPADVQQRAICDLALDFHNSMVKVRMLFLSLNACGKHFCRLLAFDIFSYFNVSVLILFSSLGDHSLFHGCWRTSLSGCRRLCRKSDIMYACHLVCDMCG